MPLLRLFLAVDTPPEAKAALTEIQNRLRGSGADARWESEPKLHITLKFIGDTNPDLLPDFVSLSKGVASRRGPFDITYRGVGCFPHMRDPRIIWAGVDDPSGGLAALAGELDEACTQLGIPREQKQFHAHVTLGRVKSRRNIGGLLARMESATFEDRPATVSAILLMKSDLKPDGSVYTTLHQFPLRT